MDGHRANAVADRGWNQTSKKNISFIFNQGAKQAVCCRSSQVVRFYPIIAPRGKNSKESGSALEACVGSSQFLYLAWLRVDPGPEQESNCTCVEKTAASLSDAVSGAMACSCWRSLFSAPSYAPVFGTMETGADWRWLSQVGRNYCSPSAITLQTWARRGTEADSPTKGALRRGQEACAA